MNRRIAILSIAVLVSVPADATFGRTKTPRATLVIAEASQQQTGSAVLLVAGGLSTSAGTVNPLAGKTVVLFKEGFENFLRRTGMFAGPAGAATKVSPLVGWSYACVNGMPVCGQALYEARPNAVAEAKMDNNATATFQGVPAGTYFLYATTAYNKQHLVWDFKIDLKAGANSITLDYSNITPLDAAQTKAKAAAGGTTHPASATATVRTNDAQASPRPNGSKNSVLNVRAIDESRQPLGRTVFYLVDDDFENLLRRAGMKPQMLLGKELPLLNSFEFYWRVKLMKDNNPMFALLESMSGGGAEVTGDIEEQYQIGAKALADHTVATIKTDIYGKASFPSVPAGTYYVYGTSNQFVRTGARGTVSGNTVSLNDTGYNKATIWNLKVTIKAGPNKISLTPDNATFVGN